MSFRIEKDANLDSLQTNSLISPSLNKPMIYLTSYGVVQNLSFIGSYGSSTDTVDTQVVVPFSGSFTRLFVCKTGGAPSDSIFFTIFINDAPITDTQTLTGASVTAGLSFLNPTTVDYAAGDRVAIRLSILNGADPLLSLTLF